MSIRHSLLALLSTQSMYGQQLRDEFEARTGELWPLNVGQVYTTLGRLERDGLVESLAGDDAALRPYRITEAGRIELTSWFRTAPEASSPPRDELVMKVMIAVSVDRDAAPHVIQIHRRRVLEQMQQFTRMKTDDASTATLMICDAQLFRLEAELRWLDAAEARLRAGAHLDQAHPTSPDAGRPLADHTIPPTPELVERHRP